MGQGDPIFTPAKRCPPFPRGCAGSSRSRDPSGADGTRNTYGFAFQPPSQSCFSAGRRRGGDGFFFFFFNIFSLGILIFFKKKTKKPMYNPVLEPQEPLAAEHGAPCTDGARWLIGSLSVCPCLGTQLTARNPRREGQILESLTKQR